MVNRTYLDWLLQHLLVKRVDGVMKRDPEYTKKIVYSPFWDLFIDKLIEYPESLSAVLRHIDESFEEDVKKTIMIIPAMFFNKVNVKNCFCHRVEYSIPDSPVNIERNVCFHIPSSWADSYERFLEATKEFIEVKNLIDELRNLTGFDRGALDYSEALYEYTLASSVVPMIKTVLHERVKNPDFTKWVNSEYYKNTWVYFSLKPEAFLEVLETMKKGAKNHAEC